MATVHRFEDLESWQKARLLTRHVYTITRQGPFARDYGLRDQMRKASLSIMSNIAEGFERSSTRAFHHFLSIAKGSAAEVKSQLYVALDEAYVTQATFVLLRDLIDEITRLIAGLMHYLLRRQHYNAHG